MKKLKLAAAAVIAAIMLVCMAVAVSAASRLSVTSVPSDSDLGTQLFTVSNQNSDPVTFSWGCAQTADSGTQTVAPGGAATIAVPDSGMSGRTIYVKYTLNGAGDIIYCGSTNRYYVYVEYRLADGTLLNSEKEVISKSAGSISVSAPEVYDGAYRLISKSTLGHVFDPSVTVAGRTLTFTYKEIVPEPYNIKAVYVDAETGSVIGNVSYNVPVNGSVEVIPEATYTSGRVYALGAGQGAVTHSYGDTELSYTFYYTAVPENPDKPYVINIKYVDSVTGIAFASRNVTIPVGETVTCVVPAMYITGDCKQYNRSAGQPETIVHAANSSQRSYTVQFTRNTASMTSPYDITVRYADAATGTVLRSLTRTVAVNGSVTVEPDDELTVDGSVYTMATGQKRTISHSYGDAKTVYIVYYDNAAGEASKPYEITIKYADNVSNAILYSVKVTVPIRQMVYHSAPATFVRNGVEYTVCAGQSRIAHDYSSARRTYVVFYKNEGATSAPETPVTEVPGITIVDDAEAVRIMAQSTATTEAELNEINDALDNSVDADSAPENEITIADNEIPLAGGAGNTLKAEAQSKVTESTPVVIVIAAGTVCLLALGAIVVAAICTLRRKKSV